LERFILVLIVGPVFLVAGPLALVYAVLRGSAVIVEEALHVYRNWDRPPGEHWFSVGIHRPGRPRAPTGS
jgi:hypothetical protein